MLGLTFGSLRHARWHGLCSATIVCSVKPKSVHAFLNRRKISSNKSPSTFSSTMNEVPSKKSQEAGMLDEMIARSQNSSDVQRVGVELPEVARIPSRKRTFHFDHDDLDSHVEPLLSCHWHVSPVGNVTDSLQVLSLNKLFSFKDFRSAVDFFDAVADVQDEENHHARVTVDYANVYVSVHTHVAYQRVSGADANVLSVKVPGLTARDVRFAIKVERLHERFLAKECAVTKVPADSTSLRAWSMEQLRRRYLVSCG